MGIEISYSCEHIHYNFPFSTCSSAFFKVAFGYITFVTSCLKKQPCSLWIVSVLLPKGPLLGWRNCPSIPNPHNGLAFLGTWKGELRLSETFSHQVLRNANYYYISQNLPTCRSIRKFGFGKRIF